MKKPILIIIVLVIIGGATFLIFFNRDNTSKVSTTKSAKGFTFQVTVPENTPDQDTVFLLITDIPPASIELPMKKVSDNTWELSFTEAELEPAYDFPNIRYRYTRNGWGFTTAEALPEGIARAPNIKPEDEKGSGYDFRVATLKKGKEQTDTVDRWRWFPKGEIVLEDISDLGPTQAWQERVNNTKFRLGQGIEDLYLPQFDPFFGLVAKRLKDEGFTWVVVYPPWQWVELEPLPKVGNNLNDNPNYPDEKLVEQIQAFKKAGLKVYVEPQLCCVSVNTKNRSAEWWEAYISEVERFLIHQAQVTSKAGADAFLFESFNIDQEMEGYAGKMKTMFDKIKSEFDGEISTKVSAFLPEGIEQATTFIPDIDRISWGHEVDFFIYDAEGQLSEKDNPTKEELVAGAGRIVDLVKELNDTFNKPVMVRSTYFAVKQAWKGTEFLQSGKIPAHETYEYDFEGHEFSGIDQARVDAAFFEAISTRPWIIGFLHFGYTHWDMPRLTDWNIRAREAEQVWILWNEFINNS